MNRIHTKTDIVYNKKTKKDIIIVHISDVHFNINTNSKKLDKIKTYLNKIKPDYIMITGDLIDSPKITKNTTKIKELLVFLSSIAKIAKVMISLGNHDVMVEDDHKFFVKLNDLYNIYVLDNNYYQDEFIYVSGYTLPDNYYYNITGEESEEILLNYLSLNSNLYHNLPDKLFKIALIHSPIKLTEKNILNILKEYDLILSGHTHNGMVPDFLNFIFKKNYGFIAPNKKLFPVIAKGKIEKNINNKTLTIIISGGITKLSLHSSKILNKLNFVYNIDINKIIIKKK